ncbi:MAG: glycosyltransferase family 39 protein [Candidatus Levybacteria bacterium]|nr:glycosyltransferase family 39 protein [Candidatus Levybacteria bacterium]
MNSASTLITILLAINICVFLSFIFTKHYFPFFIFINILSIIILWGIVWKEYVHRSIVAHKGKEILIVLGLFGVAFLVRLYGIENVTPGMYGDEVTVAVQSLQLLNQKEWLPFIGNYSHPTPLLYMTAASIEVFGHTITAVRLPSILFGALTVGAFYILLRIHLPGKFALLGAILLLFQYSHIVLSRLAYEPAAALFFQVLTVIFLSLYYKTKEKYVLVAIALVVGIGLYTYLSFRAFAIAIVLMTFLVLWKQTTKNRLQQAALFISILFIAAMPLFSYAIIDGQGFGARTSEISLFSRGYASEELVRELSANVYRTITLPFIGIPGSNPPSIGDPNPGKNPSGVTIFDPITTIFVIIGFVYLFRYKRGLFYIVLLLLLPAIISDIFSTEVIPNLHYYGLGHPNMLRISGIIIVILFVATYGLYAFFTWIGKDKGVIAVSCLVGFACLINWFWYFGQANITRTFYLYNYKVNKTDVIQMITYVNASSAKKVSMTTTLAENREYIAFFLHPDSNVSQFALNERTNILDIITQSDVTVIEINPSTIAAVNALLTTDALNSGTITMHEIKGVVDQPDIVVFEKVIH